MFGIGFHCCPQQMYLTIFSGCWLQSFLTCPQLSHGTNFSSNWAKVAKGRGIYWWVMYLHWNVFVQYKNIFLLKKTKNRDCSSVWLLCQCISIAMCYYTTRSSLTWLVLHTEGKICSVMWCAVQYSRHPTSITVLSSICFIYAILQYRHDLFSWNISCPLFFKTPPIWYMQFSVLSSQR